MRFARQLRFKFILKLIIKTEKEIVNLVEKVIEGKKKGIDTREFEVEIDKIVYGLYNLNENEIKIIEGKD